MKIAKILLLLFMMSSNTMVHADQPTWTTNEVTTKDSEGYHHTQICETECQNDMCSTNCG